MSIQMDFWTCLCVCLYSHIKFDCYPQICNKLKEKQYSCSATYYLMYSFHKTLIIKWTLIIWHIGNRPLSVYTCLKFQLLLLFLFLVLNSKQHVRSLAQYNIQKSLLYSFSYTFYLKLFWIIIIKYHLI